ncbi:hypothetical protein ASPACDRAFT_39031 [Aspergillus aculeatus ATCC 16872]|uniref:Uncharacterized protein n=1 Tax=Aspergillus aculeatus (strain ATCC 16872 / CBS 172.66 / WB 5094) TaxID=690307 RepID=A0A1L9X512_ASPA1|nr:uncharacterized protein ASPACDRAFT_39031 [Aspergillus aculeatus ATCC 16872]OJK03414.1 hypothetical protein ASPACDRAFT_39031 [Aspergillus aculeatus ATCC 16872]
MCTSTIRTYRCGCVLDESTHRCTEATNPDTDTEKCPGLVVEHTGSIDEPCAKCARLEEEPVEVYSDGAVSESDADVDADADADGYENLNRTGPGTMPYTSGVWERNRLIMYDYADWVKSRGCRRGGGQHGSSGNGPPPPPSADGFEDDHVD